jgi:hypothetical protein
LHFPLNRSLGKLYRLNLADPVVPSAEASAYAQASGTVTVPANTKLMLQISYIGATDLAPLASCSDQDVIYSIDANHVENLSDRDLQEIGKLKSVKQLLLSNTDTTDKGLQYIATSMPQLLHLDLCATMITARGLDSLRSLTALKKLELDYLSTKGTDLAGLVPMTHLQFLAIARAQLTDNAMKNLGKVTSLVRLKVAKNAITDEGVFYLANLKNLQDLDLNETRVTKRCLPSLQKMTRLRAVKISLAKEELAKMEQSLGKTNPGCQVQYKGPESQGAGLF